MVMKRIPLGKKQVYLDVYAPDRITDRKWDALLVIPGGAYHDVCSDREGEPIALSFLPYGFAAFVLHYSVAGNSENRYPAQLLEAAAAMRHIRTHADDYNVDPARVFATGFSAGGHLAGCLATMADLPALRDAGFSPEEVRPRAVFLGYPWVCTKDTPATKACARNLLGHDPDDAEFAAVRLDACVTAKTAPTFLFHTANDPVVPVCNSLHLADALDRAHVPFELHVFPDGPHGMALGNDVTRCSYVDAEDESIAKWVELAVHFAKKV